MWKIPLCLLFAVSLYTQAGAAVRCPPGMTVALYEYGLMYHDGKGIDKDVVEELQRRSQCPFRVRLELRSNIWKELANGQLMMSVSAIRYPEREEYARFSIPYVRLKNLALLPRTVAANAGTPEAFLADPKLRWGQVRSFKHGVLQDAIVERFRQENRLDEADNSEQLFDWLRSGKIQGAFFQSTSYSLFFKLYNTQSTIITRDWAPQDHGVEGRLVFSKKLFSEEDVQQWSALLDEMRSDGTMEKILRRYLPDFEVNRVLIR